MPAHDTQRYADSFVVEYVAIMADDAPVEIARLAATIARAEGNSASALVGQAIAIRIEAERAVNLKRNGLLDSADAALLHSVLMYFVSHPDSAFRKHGEKIDAYMKDRQRKEWEEVMKKAREAENSPELEAWRKAFLASLETQCGGPLPPLPCTLEAAIRWATGAPVELPWKILEGAFDDYLVLACANHVLQEAAQQDDRKHLTDYIAWHGAVADNEANPEASRAEFRTKTENARAQLKFLDDLANFVDNYAPRRSWPARLAGDIREAQKAWKERLMELWQTKSFESLATRFRAFWNEHRYQAKWQAIRDKQSQAAVGTNQKRNPNYWSDDLILDLVKSFVGKHSPSERTAESARTFTFPDRDETDVREILGTLIALKNIPQEKAVATAINNPICTERLIVSGAG